MEMEKIKQGVVLKMQNILSIRTLKFIPLAILFTLIGLLLFSVQVQAQEKEANFDLTKHEKQTVEVTDENGNTGTITMEPVDTSENEISTQNLSPGTNIWRTYYNVGSLSAEFYSEITVSNNIATINRVYNPSYHSFPGTITSDTLSIVRQTETGNLPAEATYRIAFDRYPEWLGSGTAQLTLQVQGTTATTSQEGFWL